jgi:uncharacterized membrane protein YgdD (TMEM256/DUF423 family)
MVISPLENALGFAGAAPYIVPTTANPFVCYIVRHMNWINTAGISGFIAVACGAFGAHWLKTRLTPELLGVWQTGVLYHLIHALALLALALYGKQSGRNISWGAGCFLTGTILFSGSLYALALTGVRGLGAITPLGGVCFLLGWGWVAVRLAVR